MSTRIVNLRTARKNRARAAKQAGGDANAVRFGRTKAERKLQTARADKARRDLGGHEVEE